MLNSFLMAASALLQLLSPFVLGIVQLSPVGLLLPHQMIAHGLSSGLLLLPGLCLPSRILIFRFDCLEHLQHDQGSYIKIMQ